MRDAETIYWASSGKGIVDTVGKVIYKFSISFVKKEIWSLDKLNCSQINWIDNLIGKEDKSIIFVFISSEPDIRKQIYKQWIEFFIPVVKNRTLPSKDEMQVKFSNFFLIDQILEEGFLFCCTCYDEIYPQKY
jgi:hypothetical protein